MPLRPVAHAAPQPDPALLATHVLAGVGSGLLLALGVTALSQRGSRSYLLVVLALAALVGRTAVSVVAIYGPLPPDLHHLVEHGLDAMVVTFLLLAIYYARSNGPRPGFPGSDTSGPEDGPADSAGYGDATADTTGHSDATADTTVHSDVTTELSTSTSTPSDIQNEPPRPRDGGTPTDSQPPGTREEEPQ